MKAPFPYFGGKRRIASKVWQALGDVDHYIEPFFGSGAVLFSRVDWQGKTETINDKDAFISNVWRSIKYQQPDKTATYCLYPIHHSELIARKKFIFKNKERLYRNIIANPDFYDARMAGYWIYAASLSNNNQIPSISNNGKGVFRSEVNDIQLYFNKLSSRLSKVRVCNGDWNQILGGNWQDKSWKSVGIFLDPPYKNFENLLRFNYEN